MLTTVNRVLLALTGLLLFGFGAAALAGALDLAERWGFNHPDGWSWRTPQDVLLTRTDRTQWRDEGWWWPVVIGVLAALVLLSLWWALAQLRRQRLSEVLVDSGDGVGAVLRGRAVEDVVTAEAEALSGIDRARIALEGSRTRPRARVRLLLAPHAQPADAVHRLRTEALEHARVSAGLEGLPSDVRLRAARHGAERVS
ncbi:alkaline shock response membrane anchor protein AmaP [Streptomyces sp. ACA25]|uniref:alkaline shock response membrane anchor protein AmaP n=1 Tax=Streptomyces sp. ACA25 TaxID=3022596 RepID=UPI00230815CA|nr:alkaline shock response membrane anchor protein AmaP [Streptomyces sp. ACA25]MDB1088426.1 alkaline shock response membrane anchor protein AmaP [Streptomyces sp. ACA25]